MCITTIKRATILLAILIISYVFPVFAAPLSIELLKPNGGETFNIGDTLKISWRFEGENSDSLHNVVFRLSTNDGLEFTIPLFTKGHVYQGNTDSVRWVIPKEDRFISNNVFLQVYEYSNIQITDDSDKLFTILGQKTTPEIPKDSIKNPGIVDGWRTMSNGLPGKVVYGNGQSIYVMTLATGGTTKIADFYGTSSHKWSPDGSRLCIQNNQELRVMNSDGSNSKSIWKGGLNGDLVASGWDGNTSVVYSTCSKIAKTEILADNSGGTTEYIYTKSPSKSGKCFSSIGKSGDFICFLDMEANTTSGGYHRPCLYNIKTAVLKELVGRNADGCTLRLRQDSSGVTMYNYWNHDDPARIVDKNGTIIDSLPAVSNNGIGGMRWSNKPQFIVHNDDGGSKAWVRDISTKKFVYLGTDIGWPDLWVGNSATNRKELTRHTYLSRKFNVVTDDKQTIISTLLSEHFDAQLISPQGRTVQNYRASKGAISITTKNLSSGIYLVTINGKHVGATTIKLIVQ